MRTCSARETRIGKDPVHFVGRRFNIPLMLTPGFGPPHVCAQCGYYD
jgi:hypothetical protein